MENHWVENKAEPDASPMQLGEKTAASSQKKLLDFIINVPKVNRDDHFVPSCFWIVMILYSIGWALDFMLVDMYSHLT